MKNDIEGSTEKIWKSYSGKLLNFIRKKVSGDDAEDILQEVFLKIHSSLNSVSDRGKIEPWIFAVTRNAINDFYRNKKKSDKIIDLLNPVEDDDAKDVRRELSECLLPIIESLPEKYKQPLIMAELEGRKQKEIAEIENISLSGAKSRVQRGRGLLKKILLDCCKFEFDKENRVISYEPKKKDCIKC